MKGDFDVEAPGLPIHKVVQHGNLRIGFTHGHTIVPQADSDSLLIEARRLDCDVLLWGGTHRFEAYELEGKFFVNPGSATGAISSGWWGEKESPVPSFVLMDVRAPLAVPVMVQLLIGWFCAGPGKCARDVCLPAPHGREGQRERGGGKDYLPEGDEWIVEGDGSGGELEGDWLQAEGNTRWSFLSKQFSAYLV